MATLTDFDERRIEFLCDPHTYIEAATSVEHGAVRFEEFTLERARALVEDGEIRESIVWIAGDKLRWSCTCDSWSDEKLCVHVAATAIAAWRDLPREAGGREDVLKGETQEAEEPFSGVE